MTEERALKIGLNLQNIGYQVDDETLKKIKPFKDAIEAEILEELREQNQEKQEAEKESYNQALEDFINYAYVKGIDFSFMGRIMENGESDVPVRLKKIKDDFLEQKEREGGCWIRYKLFENCVDELK